MTIPDGHPKCIFRCDACGCMTNAVFSCDGEEMLCYPCAWPNGVEDPEYVKRAHTYTEESTAEAKAILGLDND